MLRNLVAYTNITGKELGDIAKRKHTMLYGKSYEPKPVKNLNTAFTVNIQLLKEQPLYYL